MSIGMRITGTTMLFVVMLFALVFNMSQPAKAQDLDWESEELVGAWINVFVQGEFTIHSVKSLVGTTHTVQQIDGSDQLHFHINRAVSMMGYEARFGERDVLRHLGVTPGNSTGFMRLKVHGGKGVTFRNRGCQYVFAGLSGRATGLNGYQYTVGAYTCGDPGPFLEYFDKIRPATRDSNTAELALHADRGRTTSTRSSKSRLQIDCEDATGGGNERKLAAFMRRISEAQLARFLSARMNCDTFAN